MKIAILSDIHGNFTALTAVINDIKKFGIEGFIVAGDSIGIGPQPDEVIDTLKNLNSWIIKGNHEKYIIDYHKGFCEEWKQYRQMAPAVWTHDNMSETNIKWIDGLLEQLSINFKETNAIRVVHGSPFDIFEQLYPYKNLDRLEKSLLSINETILICGHTHEQWHKCIHGKLVVNPGSVGIHFNKNHCAEYSILECKDNIWKCYPRQVKYDLNELESRFIESGMLKEGRAWVRVTLQSIREGKNLSLEFIKFAFDLTEKRGLKNFSLVPNNIWDKAEELWFNK